MAATRTQQTEADRTRGLHVAIIMDGNGRWATRRGLPRIQGHREGVKAARRAVESALSAGVGCLTLYAFSSDNWSRPAPEVQGIFWLLRAFLRMETERMRQQGVRIQVIGRRDRLASNVLRAVETAEHTTSEARQLHLRVAVDYSSRTAILQVAVDAAHGARVAGRCSVESLREEMGRSLSADGDVDLLIRTGGEKRLSDFLLWESAYAELIFTDRMWPEFNRVDLERALMEFRRRDRRFGALDSAHSEAGKTRATPRFSAIAEPPSSSASAWENTVDRRILS